MKNSTVKAIQKIHQEELKKGLFPIGLIFVKDAIKIIEEMEVDLLNQIEEEQRKQIKNY